MYYSKKEVLITGGLGFIGSNLAIRLSQLGARVTIIDSCEPGCGGDVYNIAPIADGCTVVNLDIADADKAVELIRRAEVIFNLAGEISHVHSMQFPERDLRINSLAQLRFLQVCAREAPGVRMPAHVKFTVFPRVCRWMRITQCGPWISTACTSLRGPCITSCSLGWGSWMPQFYASATCMDRAWRSASPARAF